MAGEKLISQGTTIAISNENADTTAYGSATFDTIGGVKTISDPDGEAQAIDTTDLNSTAKEFMMGLPDNGKFTLGGDYKVADAGQSELKTARNAQQKRWIRITDSASAVSYFKAVVTRYSDLAAEVDSVRKFSATLIISGAIS